MPLSRREIGSLAPRPAQFADSASLTDEIAQREGLHHSTVNELLRLMLLEPAIIQSILAGRQPRLVRLLWFQRNPLPTDWVAQRAGRVAGFDA